jgi:hypothetical protein
MGGNPPFGSGPGRIKGDMLDDTVPFRTNGAEDDGPGEVVDVGVGGAAFELV